MRQCRAHGAVRGHPETPQLGGSERVAGATQAGLEGPIIAVTPSFSGGLSGPQPGLGRVGEREPRRNKEDPASETVG